MQQQIGMCAWPSRAVRPEGNQAALAHGSGRLSGSPCVRPALVWLALRASLSPLGSVKGAEGEWEEQGEGAVRSVRSGFRLRHPCEHCPSVAAAAPGSSFSKGLVIH